MVLDKLTFSVLDDGSAPPVVGPIPRKKKGKPELETPAASGQATPTSTEAMGELELFVALAQISWLMLSQSTANPWVSPTARP